MRFNIVIYNIFEGGIDTSNSTRLDAIADFLRSLNPSLVVLTELNGFDRSKYSEFARRWNHPHTAFLSAKTSFHLAISSTFPINELAQVEENMHHGALFVQVKFDDQTSIGLVATHLSPYKPMARTIEAKQITNQIQQYELKHWIIAGDLNSLAEVDAIQYVSPEKFTTTDRLKAKFLTPNADAIDYSTIQHFLQRGFVDVLAKSDHFRPTVPTKLEVDPMHALQMRLDYILVSRALAEKLIEARVLNDDRTALLSDHYPVISTFMI